MKKTIGMLSFLLVIACSPDKQLIEENERLKAQVLEQKELAMRAAAEAMKAQAAAEAEAESSRIAQGEALRQAAIANAERKAAEELLKKLKDCQ